MFRVVLTRKRYIRAYITVLMAVMYCQHWPRCLCTNLTLIHQLGEIAGFASSRVIEDQYYEPLHSAYEMRLCGNIIGELSKRCSKLLFWGCITCDVNCTDMIVIVNRDYLPCSHTKDCLLTTLCILEGIRLTIGRIKRMMHDHVAYESSFVGVSCAKSSYC